MNAPSVERRNEAVEMLRWLELAQKTLANYPAESERQMPAASGARIKDSEVLNRATPAQVRSARDAEIVNYYWILNISPATPAADIRKAITRELRLWVNRTNAPQMERRKEAERMVQTLEEAERVLLDPTQKADYDASVVSGVPSIAAEADPEEAESDRAAIHDAVVPGDLPEQASSRRVDRSMDSPDVCSHSVGVVVNGRNHVVIPRNTPIPCEVKHVVLTEVDNQTEITIQVTEGEDEELEYVTIALEAPLKIPPYPKGASVEVTFQYDANGVIRITVLDLTAKKSLGEVQLVRKGNLTDEQVKAKQVDLRKVAVN
jgi:hypothetical protein